MNHPSDTADRIQFSGRIVTWVIIGVAIIRLWVMPLGSSFWIDETGTYWAIKDGLGRMLERIGEWPTVSPFYGSLAWTAYSIGGAHEYVLRLPSLIAAGVAVVLLHRLSLRLFNPDAALASTAFFVCTYPVLFAAGDARPYALVLAVVCASTLSLVCWLDKGSVGYGVCYVLTAGVIPHTHYFAALVLPFHVIYVILRIREGVALRSRPIILAGLGVALLATPLLPRVLKLARTAPTLAVGSAPTPRDVIAQLMPAPLLLGLILGVVVAWFTCRGLRLARLPVPASTVVLLVSLFLAPTALFLALTLLTPIRVFIPRYLIVTNVAQALLAGWAVALLHSARARMLVTFSLAFCPLAVMGSWDQLWPWHSRDDWRDAMATTRRLAAGRPLTVVFETPFIESFTTTARPELSSNLPGFLFSPLSMYPAPGRIIPIALVLDDLSRSYLESTVVPEITRDTRFVLVTWLGPNPYDDWFERRLPDYKYRRLGDFGTVNVTLFDRVQ